MSSMILGDISYDDTPDIVKRLPTGYQNPTLSPWCLLVSAIFENRRHYNAPILPKCIYVSELLLKQLPDDMQVCCLGTFNGKTIPFTLLNGEVVNIPIMSAEDGLGIHIARYAVWCSN